MLPGIAKLVVQKRETADGSEPGDRSDGRDPGEAGRQGAHREAAQGRGRSVVWGARPGQLPGGAAAGARELERADFETTWNGQRCVATDPLLALIHMPLRKVPQRPSTEGPTPRHINVSVEHTDYAPVGLT